MRVAVFTDNDFNKVNGVTTTLNAVLDHAPADVRPRVYTAAGLGCDQPDYLALRSLALPIPYYRDLRMYVPKWRQYLKRAREDRISLVHLTTPGPLGLTALWVAKETGLPLVGSFHTDLRAYTSMLRGSPRLGAWMKNYIAWMYRRCQVVFVPSAAARNALMAQGLPGERLVILPRGVNTTLFDPIRRSTTVRAGWRADSDHPVLLYVGRVSKENDVDLLPAMLGRLRSLGSICRLVIAGDGPFRRQLADLCPEAIFTGTLGGEFLADVFASADVFVFPGRSDTAGSAVLEAQASGLPVVVSEAGGPHENVVPGITGLICEGDDPSYWADAVATLVRNAEARRAMGGAARRYALGRNWDRALEPLFDTYRRLSEAHATVRPVVGHAA